MPRGPNGERRPAGAHECAVMVAKIATGEVEDGRYVSPGRRKSGIAGAAARAEALTKGERLEIAAKAARARWGADADQG